MVSSNILWMSSSLLRSPVIVNGLSAAGLSCWHLVATDLRFSSFLPVKAKLAPHLANNSAMAAPSPELDPVITHVDGFHCMLHDKKHYMIMKIIIILTMQQFNLMLQIYN